MVNYAVRAIAHSKDISDGGLCLITEEPLIVGKIYTLAFTLPGETQEFQIYGKVAWSRKATTHHHENGISFWEIAAGVKSRLTAYLRRTA